MKKKILIIALITLSAILVSIIVSASVMISLYNDRYSGTVVHVATKQYINDRVPDSLSIDFLGVDYDLKYDHSESGTFNSEWISVYIDEQQGYKVEFSNDWILNNGTNEYSLRNGLLGIGATGSDSLVYAYDKDEVVYDEYVEWLKDVIYELYSVDVSEYVLRCQTYYWHSDSKSKTDNRFIPSEEANGKEIRGYRFVFTKYINGIETETYFYVAANADGDIELIKNRRFEPGNVDVASLDLDEGKIKRSIYINVYLYYAMQNNTFYFEEDYFGEAGSITLRRYNGRIVLDCEIKNIQTINKDGVEGNPRIFHVILYVDE